MAEVKLEQELWEPAEQNHSVVCELKADPTGAGARSASLDVMTLPGKRRSRRFSEKETLVLVQEVKKRKKMIYGSSNSVIVMQAWAEVAALVSSSSGIRRKPQQCRKRYNDVRRRYNQNGLWALSRNALITSGFAPAEDITYSTLTIASVESFAGVQVGTAAKMAADSEEGSARRRSEEVTAEWQRTGEQPSKEEVRRPRPSSPQQQQRDEEVPFLQQQQRDEEVPFLQQQRDEEVPFLQQQRDEEMRFLQQQRDEEVPFLQQQRDGFAMLEQKLGGLQRCAERLGDSVERLFEPLSRIADSLQQIAASQFPTATASSPRGSLLAPPTETSSPRRTRGRARRGRPPTQIQGGRKRQVLST